MLALKGDKEIGDKINKIIGKLAEANDLQKVIDLADFNDEEKLGKGKEMQDRLTKLVTIFNDLDFRRSRAEGDDLLGDAYEYLMRHFATESGKSKGQFYIPAEVSRVLAKVVGIGPQTRQDQTVYDPPAVRAPCCSRSQLLEPMVDAVPAAIGPRGRPGRPRRRPAKLHGDKGYDYPTCRRMQRPLGVSPRIARRGIESTTRLGRHRWKVERSLAWLLANRRLTVRFERRADILTGFLHLACALICARKLQPLWTTSYEAGLLWEVASSA